MSDKKKRKRPAKEEVVQQQISPLKMKLQQASTHCSEKKLKPSSAGDGTDIFGICLSVRNTETKTSTGSMKNAYLSVLIGNMQNMLEKLPSEMLDTRGLSFNDEKQFLTVWMNKPKRLSKQAKEKGVVEVKPSDILQKDRLYQNFYPLTCIRVKKNYGEVATSAVFKFVKLSGLYAETYSDKNGVLRSSLNVYDVLPTGFSIDHETLHSILLSYPDSTWKLNVPKKHSFSFGAVLLQDPFRNIEAAGGAMSVYGQSVGERPAQTSSSSTSTATAEETAAANKPKLYFSMCGPYVQIEQPEDDEEDVEEQKEDRESDEEDDDSGAEESPSKKQKTDSVDDEQMTEAAEAEDPAKLYYANVRAYQESFASLGVTEALLWKDVVHPWLGKQSLFLLGSVDKVPMPSGSDLEFKEAIEMTATLVSLDLRQSLMRHAIPVTEKWANPYLSVEHSPADDNGGETKFIGISLLSSSASKDRKLAIKKVEKNKADLYAIVSPSIMDACEQEWSSKGGLSKMNATDGDEFLSKYGGLKDAQGITTAAIYCVVKKPMFNDMHPSWMQKIKDIMPDSDETWSRMERLIGGCNVVIKDEEQAAAEQVSSSSSKTKSSSSTAI